MGRRMGGGHEQQARAMQFRTMESVCSRADGAGQAVAGLPWLQLRSVPNTAVCSLRATEGNGIKKIRRKLAGQIQYAQFRAHWRIAVDYNGRRGVPLGTGRALLR